MIEIPNSFDLMTNMHHTNPQLVEISTLNQQNSQLHGSNKLMKFALVGLLVIALLVIFESKQDRRNKNE